MYLKGEEKRTTVNVTTKKVTSKVTTSKVTTSQVFNTTMTTLQPTVSIPKEKNNKVIEIYTNKVFNE